jgi:hypothetical protein
MEDTPIEWIEEDIADFRLMQEDKIKIPYSDDWLNVTYLKFLQALGIHLRNLENYLNKEKTKNTSLEGK